MHTANNAEIIPISWRHHVFLEYMFYQVMQWSVYSYMVLIVAQLLPNYKCSSLKFKEADKLKP